MGRRRRKQKGVAAVEFALILPVVVVILVAVFEFGMAFWRKQILTAAVREGARYGVVALNPKPTSGEIDTKVRSYLTDMGWDASAASVTTTGAQGAANSDLTVVATYPTSFAILSKLPHGGTIPSSVSLQASVTMSNE